MLKTNNKTDFFLKNEQIILCRLLNVKALTSIHSCVFFFFILFLTSFNVGHVLPICINNALILYFMLHFSGGGGDIFNFFASQTINIYYGSLLVFRDAFISGEILKQNKDSKFL